MVKSCNHRHKNTVAYRKYRDTAATFCVKVKVFIRQIVCKYLDNFKQKLSKIEYIEVCINYSKTKA